MVLAVLEIERGGHPVRVELQPLTGEWTSKNTEVQDEVNEVWNSQDIPGNLMSRLIPLVDAVPGAELVEADPPEIPQDEVA